MFVMIYNRVVVVVVVVVVICVLGVMEHCRSYLIPNGAASM